jgi:hypothetical protein
MRFYYFRRRPAYAQGFVAASPTQTDTDSIKNDILDVTYIFHAGSRMKNGVMPCRQYLFNCILVHLGAIAVLFLTFLSWISFSKL